MKKNQPKQKQDQPISELQDLTLNELKGVIGGHCPFPGHLLPPNEPTPPPGGYIF